MLTGKRRHRPEFSSSHEHYLRAIWEARQRHGYARVTDVAHELGISHASLSTGLRGLEERGLVGHDPHRFLVLTPAGERVAREVHHRYSVVRRFLEEILGVERATAEREACLIEHDIGVSTTGRLVDLIRLLHDDQLLSADLRSRLTHYHRTCAPGEECGTCGLGCLTPGPTA